MFVLDANVVSELMYLKPEPAITSWVEDHAASVLCLTAISDAELRFGLAAVVPSGRRRDGLAAGLERMLRTGFANRVLPSASAAARAHAEIAAIRRATGRPISQSHGHAAWRW